MEREKTENKAEENQLKEEKPTKEKPLQEEKEPVAAPTTTDNNVPNKDEDPFSGIAESLTAAKPEKQDYFVKATKDRRDLKSDREEVENNNQDWRFLKDSSGRYWDAEYCENKADVKTGLPVKTAKGLWKLKRSATAADRKKLPKRPPNIEAKKTAAIEAEQAQIEAEAEAARIQQSSIITVKAVMSGYKALFSKISGEKAVSDVMGYKIGEGQYKVSINDLIEGSGVEMMVKRGGGFTPPPELTFIGGLGVCGVAMYFHPSRPERKATVSEKAGILWRRIWNRKKKEQPNEEQRQGGQE